MPSALTIKLVAGAAAILLLALLIYDRNHWMKRAHADEAQIAAICSSARDASNNPKLKCTDVPKQIALLGESLAATRGALDRQNAAVDALAAKQAGQQSAAAKASQEAAERAGAALAVSGRLDASSRAGEAQAKPCAPSKALTEAWQ